MAKAVGQDPTKGHVRRRSVPCFTPSAAYSLQTIPFHPTDKKFLKAYFDILHHPLEAEGVDLWWPDWQQGEYTTTPGIDPLWMLNHYHFLDSGRDGKRPMGFDRYAGPGSQRYPIGFSGVSQQGASSIFQLNGSTFKDTVITWETLDFQPEFTATASNIGFGWWSHDIGGHHRGYKVNLPCSALLIYIG